MNEYKKTDYNLFKKFGIIYFIIHLPKKDIF